MILRELLNIISFGYEPEYGQIAFVHIVYFNQRKEEKLEFNFGLSETSRTYKERVLNILPEKILNAKATTIHMTCEKVLCIGCLDGIGK